MGVIKYKPTSDGRRFRSSLDFEQITTDEPTKSLLQPKKRASGRNNNGRITVRRRGGGHKRKIRIVDFKREKVGIPAKVASVEYDPNRKANICLVNYADGEKRYIIHPQGLKVGDTVQSGPDAPYEVGNAHHLINIPLGELIHNIELRPGGGAKIVRSAGASAQLMAKVGKYVMVRLPSGEQRRVLGTCMATMGVVGNTEWGNVSIGKAGANRWRGKRPKVRGVAMNPVDHPHGGGEGKTSGGRHPVTPWGVPTKGFKTRKNKLTDKFIVRRRGKK